MKTKLGTLVAMLLVASVMVGSCSKNDDHKDTPNQNVLTAFNKMFPGASQTSWDKEDGYYVADFYNAQFNAEAWFNDAGSWFLTETEIPINAFPSSVMDSFKTSRYYNWEIEDTYKIERVNIEEATYIIEVEIENEEVKLVYDISGKLLSEINDSDNTNTGTPPVVVPEAIQSYIDSKYSGAKVLYFDRERTTFEVDILYNNKQIELLFNNETAAWIESNWEITLQEAPTAVQDAFNASKYADYIIEEIEAIERTSGMLFEFEVKKGNEEILITFNNDGTIVSN